MADSSAQIAVSARQSVQSLENTAVEYLRATGTKLSPQYEAQFVNLCKAFGLNPFKREVYAVLDGDKWNVIIGYEVYLKRAERLGKLDGWGFKIEKRERDTAGVLTVYRKDWKMPFVHEVYLSECAQNSSIWQKMPFFMLKKVAIAQGFRMCFPDEFGGMPYTADELGSEESRVLPPSEAAPSVAGQAEGKTAPKTAPKIAPPPPAAPAAPKAKKADEATESQRKEFNWIARAKYGEDGERVFSDGEIRAYLEERKSASASAVLKKMKGELDARLAKRSEEKAERFADEVPF